jgi:GNAT superfamily N-acetyltransferase
VITPYRFRRAVAVDASRLYDLRRSSILAVSPEDMPADLLKRWADSRTAEWTAEIVNSRDVWVCELDGRTVGWVSATNDLVDGLYVDPCSARRGVGASLLRLIEDRIAAGGALQVRLEASWNSEGFYRRHGYLPTSPRPADGARPMAKSLAL